MTMQQKTTDCRCLDLLGQRLVALNTTHRWTKARGGPTPSIQRSSRQVLLSLRVRCACIAAILRSGDGCLTCTQTCRSQVMALSSVSWDMLQAVTAIRPMSHGSPWLSIQAVLCLLGQQQTSSDALLLALRSSTHCIKNDVYLPAQSAAQGSDAYQLVVRPQPSKSSPAAQPQGAFAGRQA